MKKKKLVWIECFPINSKSELIMLDTVLTLNKWSWDMVLECSQYLQNIYKLIYSSLNT